MAFTSAQETSIRHYLGYSQLWKYENPSLEGALGTIGGDVDASTLALSIVALIDGVWAAINGQALPAAGVASLDKGDVVLHGDHAQLADMQRIGRMYVGRLSKLCGVDVVNDIFGEEGYSKWTLAGRSHGSLTGMG